MYWLNHVNHSLLEHESRRPFWHNLGIALVLLSIVICKRYETLGTGSKIEEFLSIRMLKVYFRERSNFRSFKYVKQHIVNLKGLTFIHFELQKGPKP